MLNLIVLSLFVMSVYLVVYHHAIYPLLLKLIASQKKLLPPIIKQRRYSTGFDDTVLNKFSIVIPAYNEEKYIADKIHNLSVLDYPNDKYELILLCDGCSDRTYQVANDALAELGCSELNFQVVKYENNRGKLAVLKDGIAKARFEHIVLSDVSALLPINSLLMLDAHFAEPNVGAVSGAYRFAQQGSEGEQKYWQYQTALKSRESAVASVLGAHGAFYALRRSCYQEIPSDTINDDFLIPMNVVKQGFKVVYDPRVAAIELENVDLNQDMTRRMRIAAGNFQQLLYLLPLLSPKHGWNAINFASGKALRAITPFILLMILVTSLYLLPFHEFFYLVVVAQMVVYGGVFLVNVFNKEPSNRLLKLVCYLVNGYWVALIGTLKYVLGLQQKTWTKI